MEGRSQAEVRFVEGGGGAEKYGQDHDKEHEQDSEGAGVKGHFGVHHGPVKRERLARIRPDLHHNALVSGSVYIEGGRAGGI